MVVRAMFWGIWGARKVVSQDAIEGHMRGLRVEHRMSATRFCAMVVDDMESIEGLAWVAFREYI
jgi:hypothetical protein